ncbi:N-acetylmuramoyl-L-alanine amidase [Tissierella carlieri]|uniref:N-acetylmuramoyl-L-alanine amidase n=1 Tax=Tissierella carlieri TaxID=689904 RepID=UPI001C120B4C|nr:N-acetylmuramoyl-L-alanine amidase [Tissierella carlieri]MBU5311475.1 N-acetylmuramoyl-L-alanine amidase [Tissierella carlieri]
MSNFRFLTIEELIKELDKYPFKQLHIHHTWKPAHSSFKGNNHIAMQQSMKDFHTKSNGWSNIGQHLTLFPDGTWLTGRPFNIAPASIKNWNTGALAVEMVGNFDIPGTGVENNLGYDKLESKQKEEMLKLIKYFIYKYGESSIKFHREGPGANKTCPGTSLDKNKLIQEAKAMEEKQDIRVDLPMVLHGREKSLKAILYQQSYHVSIRTILEMLGYKVDYKDGKVHVEYKEE